MLRCASFFENLGNREPSARWTFFDPATENGKMGKWGQLPIFHWKKSGAVPIFHFPLGSLEKSPMRASGIRFPNCAKVFLRHCGGRSEMVSPYQCAPQGKHLARLACGLFTKPSHFHDR